MLRNRGGGGVLGMGTNPKEVGGGGDQAREQHQKGGLGHWDEPKQGSLRHGHISEKGRS